MPRLRRGKIVRALSTLCSHFIVTTMSSSLGIVPLLHVRRFHRFAVSPRVIPRALGVPKV